MIKTIAINTERPWDLLKLCPSYRPTPIKEISSPNGPRMLIKDETDRFNLGAFKALGGIYCLATFLLDRWALENNTEIDPHKLFEKDLLKWSNKFTFVCASAGNHGIAVAKGAQLFNSKCKVYLAENVPESFIKKLTELEAEVVRFGKTYEDSMKAARDVCEESVNEGKNEILVADSSWKGYEKMPALVMEGYTVIAEEMRQHFLSQNEWPSHIFLQAGVGGLAAAIAYHIRKHWDMQPQVIVVEPEAAPCLFESNRLGRLIKVQGPVSTMGRLDCKEASILAFELLRQYADKFVCISDSDAENTASFLAENGVLTTPSGAAGMAAIKLADDLDIPVSNDSICLTIVTEGTL